MLQLQINDMKIMKKRSSDKGMKSKNNSMRKNNKSTMKLMAETIICS